VWQLQYFIGGKRFRESAKTSSKDEASKLLNQRLAEHRAGDQKLKATTVAAIADLYLETQRARWKPGTYRWASGIWNRHLKSTFGTRNPVSILPGDIDKFVSQRKLAGSSDCYLNRSLTVLQAILRYGVRNKALRELPEFPDKFDERPYVHQGHVDSWDFETFVDCIDEKDNWLETLVTAAYIFGFRRSELLYMRRKD
jgi:integrase